MRRNADTGMKSSFKDEHEHPTLSRDLPLMIAVGKSDATCLTASRICEKKIFRKQHGKNSNTVVHMHGSLNCTWSKDLKQTSSDITAFAGLSTIGERVPS
jgi:hypothetical protein